MRAGFSPILSAVLLTGVVISLGVSAQTFLLDQQSVLIDKTKQAELTTVNLTCHRSGATWWIENTAPRPVDAVEGNLIIGKDGAINTTLSHKRALTQKFTEGNGIDSINIALPKPMVEGEQYTFRLQYRDQQVESQCQSGAPWFDSNWDYRRPVQLDTSLTDGDNTTIQLDANSLYNNGTLRSQCRDLRIVIDGTTVNHWMDVPQNDCTDQTDLDIIFNIPDISTAQGRTYVYYGNPTATGTTFIDTGSTAGAIPSTTGDEQQVNLPG